MWNRLLSIFWIFSWFLLLGCGTAKAQTASARSYLPPTTGHTTSPFSEFVGTWVAHGAVMTVSDEGKVRFEARTYNWCGSTVAQPCDSMEHNQISYGYHERSELANVSNSVAYGTVIASNIPPEQPNATLTLTLRPDDTLIYANQGFVALLCGPNAPVGACGA